MKNSTQIFKEYVTQFLKEQDDGMADECGVVLKNKEEIIERLLNLEEDVVEMICGVTNNYGEYEEVD